MLATAHHVEMYDEIMQSPLTSSSFVPFTFFEPHDHKLAVYAHACRETMYHRVSRLSMRARKVGGRGAILWPAGLATALARARASPSRPAPNLNAMMAEGEPLVGAIDQGTGSSRFLVRLTYVHKPREMTAEYMYNNTYSTAGCSCVHMASLYMYY